MKAIDLICIWTAELLPLITTTAAFIYGVMNFFKKGKPLYLQSITMAMGCYALGSLYHICLAITNDIFFDGFTPAYLGHIGFYLFFITASYGQMDRIIDDGSAELKSSRIIAVSAPVVSALLYLPNILISDSFLSTKITYLIIWIPACFSVYFNLKHALIPDLDFGFVKAIKPYNAFAVCLGFSELLLLTAQNYYEVYSMAVTAVLFSVFCALTMFFAKRGSERWTI